MPKIDLPLLSTDSNYPNYQAPISNVIYIIYMGRIGLVKAFFIMKESFSNAKCGERVRHL